MSRFARGICVDIDNVIAQTDDVMRRVIKEYTGGRVELTYADVREFNYYECKDKNGNGITKEEWKQVHELFSEARYLCQIQPIPGAIDGLHLLAKTTTL